MAARRCSVGPDAHGQGAIVEVGSRDVSEPRRDRVAAFAWQEGYSLFSVSKSQEQAVKKYIADQAEHHRREDFKSELLRILRAHGVEFEEKYVFD